MAFVELLRVVEQVCKEKGVKKEVIIEAIEQALLVAARKKYGPEVEMEVHLNQDTGEIEVYQFKTVVDDLYDEDKSCLMRHKSLIQVLH
jgi:N utilization substance protein A